MNFARCTGTYSGAVPEMRAEASHDSLQRCLHVALPELTKCAASLREESPQAAEQDAKTAAQQLESLAARPRIELQDRAAIAHGPDVVRVHAPHTQQIEAGTARLRAPGGPVSFEDRGA